MTKPKIDTTEGNLQFVVRGPPTSWSEPATLGGLASALDRARGSARGLELHDDAGGVVMLSEMFMGTTRMERIGTYLRKRGLVEVDILAQWCGPCGKQTRHTLALRIPQKCNCTICGTVRPVAHYGID